MAALFCRHAGVRWTIFMALLLCSPNHKTPIIAYLATIPHQTETGQRVIRCLLVSQS